MTAVDTGTEQPRAGVDEPGTGSRQLVAGGSLLVLAILVTNAGNYLLNLLLGRWLTPAEFSDANLMVTLMLTFTSISVCLVMVSARFIGTRDAEGRHDDAERLARTFRKWALIAGLGIAVVLAGAAPLWSNVFRTGSAVPFVILACGMPFYFRCAVGRGVMQGRFRFRPLAVTYMVEMAVRLGLGTVLVAIGLGVNGATAAASLSLVVAWGTVTLLSRHKAKGSSDGIADTTGVRKYALFVSVLLTGQIIINNGDVLISKIFLVPTEAGLYSAVALVGRAVFFLSWSVATVVFPVVASRHAKGHGGQGILAGGVVAVVGLGLTCTLGALFVGGPVLGVVLGPEYAGLSVPLAVYALATTLFAVANLIASHHLATHRLRESWVILAGAGVQTCLLLLLHGSIAQLITAQLIAMSLLLIAVVASHFLPAPRGSSSPAVPVASAGSLG
jgi:O-antigen/teichoic acid export membrane protein